MISLMHIILSILEWIPMTTIRDDIYPDLVAHFYANASKEYGIDTIDSYVKGVEIRLDRSVIRNILGLGFGGEKYKKDIRKKDQSMIEM